MDLVHALLSVKEPMPSDTTATESSTILEPTSNLLMSPPASLPSSPQPPQQVLANAEVVSVVPTAKAAAENLFG